MLDELASEQMLPGVVVRGHVRYIDGKPVIITDDYFDERIVEGTKLAAKGITAGGRADHNVDMPELDPAAVIEAVTRDPRLRAFTGHGRIEVLECGHGLPSFALRSWLSTVTTPTDRGPGQRR